MRTALATKPETEIMAKARKTAPRLDIQEAAYQAQIAATAGRVRLFASEPGLVGLLARQALRA